MLFSTSPKGYKKGVPFRLATTSYIYPDQIVPNVMKLAPLFDEIELVLFESEGKNNFPDESEIQILRAISSNNQVGFNIHLPIDIFLGHLNDKVRWQGVFIAKRVIGNTLPLNPSAYILHLDRRNESEEVKDILDWQIRVRESLHEIARFGIDPNRIAVETLGYPFEWVEHLVKEFGFSICLDVGHLLLYGQDLELYFDKYLNHTSVIHLHGHENGRDHLGIDRWSEGNLNLILPHLYDYQGIVSLEVFSLDDLQRSLEVLEKRWKRN
jgi:sugar phosphate isomerase/epimerase